MIMNEIIIIPRWIGLAATRKVEIRGFCDSSEFAFAAAIYVNLILNNSNVKVNFVVN